MSMESTTQKDPLVMAMYTLAVTPLICCLRPSDPAVSQVWYADDVTGVGECTVFWKWWDIHFLSWDRCLGMFLLKLIL